MRYWLLGLLLLSTPSLASEFRAQINRDSLMLGESLTLTLESSAAYFIDPDIAPLQQQFELLSSRYQAPTDNDLGVRRWVFELRPLKPGTLNIPPLQLGDLLSPSLPLRVFPASDNQGQSAAAFMEVSVDNINPYVQAQVLVSLRLYHAMALYADSQLLLPDSDLTHSLPLGEPKHSRQLIGDTDYGVIEMQYAVFPQSSGPLTLAAPLFAATRAHADGSSSPLQVTGDPLQLDVRPPPAEFPGDALWLPANRLELNRYTPDSTHSLPPDQALESRLVLSVEGLPASYLPRPGVPHQPGLTRYQNPPRLEQEHSPDGLHSKLELQQFWVPRQAGELQLAAIELPWWNTNSDRLEWARVAALPLTIETNIAQASSSPIHTEQLWVWQLSSALLACSSLLLCLLWLRARRMPAIQPGSRQADSQRLLEQLRKACLANQPQQARNLLDQWLRSREQSIGKLLASQPGLQSAISTLNQCLYAPGSHHWDGQELRDALEAVLQSERLQGAGQLPPLYPV